MPLTQIKGSNVSAVLTNTQLNTSGSASSSNVLPGTFAWSAASRSGLTNFAASDPATPVAGEIWFEGGNVKIAANPNILTGVWQSGGSLNNSRDYPGGCGVQSSALASSSEGYPTSQKTELYSGTTWVNVNNTIAQRIYVTQFGTSGAAVQAFGHDSGTDYATCQEFDGTSWAAGNSGSIAIRSGGSAGTLSAGIMFGGRAGTLPSPYLSSISQLYDGTSWSAANSMVKGYQANRGCGTQTAAISTCGKDDVGGTATFADDTELYDGTSWSAASNCLAVRAYGPCFGQQAAAVISGGSSGSNLKTTEEFDGTTWTSGSDMLAIRNSSASAGSSGSGGITFGGYGASTLSTSEEWNKPRIQYYDV